jgi:integrase
LALKSSMSYGITSIVQRNDRFYVVAYDGLDPLTGKERRRWHPVGHDQDEAESVAARIDRDRAGAAPPRGGPVHLGEFLTDTWLPLKRRHVRATTAYRYSWLVDRYINPDLGDVPLRRLRADHLDGLYDRLATTAGRHGTGLAPKTVHEVHMIVRSSLDLAVRRQLLDHNVAHATHARRRRPTGVRPRSWTAQELADFLQAARSQRLYPALHVAAFTGMRRGEVVGLKWSDLDRSSKRLSISRTLQSVAGNPVEFDVKTRTSRRCIDLVDSTMQGLARWRRKLYRDGLPHGVDDWIFSTPPAGSSTPNPSASCSTGSSGAHLGCPAFGSTMFATHMRVPVSWPACRSRSSANASGIRTRRSRCTPTSTCCPA